MDIKDIEHLLTIVKANEITEFELEHDGTKVRLTRGARVVQQVSVAAAMTDVQPAIGQPVGGAFSANATEISGPVTYPAHLIKVESPIVGTFYRKPSPDTEPFAKEGDHVNKGDTLCIIEAMKLMNEIDAPCDGRIEKILLSDGKVVEYGEVLFLINPRA